MAKNDFMNVGARPKKRKKDRLPACPGTVHLASKMRTICLLRFEIAVDRSDSCFPDGHERRFIDPDMAVIVKFVG
jgi:hypothetical protein